jgi:hypothetical protein
LGEGMPSFTCLDCKEMRTFRLRRGYGGRARGFAISGKILLAETQGSLADPATAGLND